MAKKTHSFIFISYNNQQGQVLIMVVLALVISLTVGLSVATRNIANVRNAAEEDNSQRAFSAAEAGAEQTLKTNVPISGSLTNNSSYQTSVSQVAGPQFLLNNGNQILINQGIGVWLSTYPSYTGPWSGNLEIDWGSASDVCNPSQPANSMAALEIVLITGTKANPVLTHYPFDPCAARQSVNNFSNVNAGNTVAGKTFAYSAIIPVVSGLVMQVIPLYAGAPIGISASSALPSQGNIIQAVGTSGSTQRKISIIQGYPALPPELFPFIMFSPK